MATPEEIRIRVEQADTARSARRAAAAQRVSELARRRADILDQLEDVERELGDVLAEAQDVIGVDELAGFTDVKPADLTAWLAGRRTGRGKLRRTTGTTNGRSTARRGAGSVTLPTSGQAPAPRESVAAAGTQDVPERLVEHAS